MRAALARFTPGLQAAHFAPRPHLVEIRGISGSVRVDKRTPADLELELEIIAAELERQAAAPHLGDLLVGLVCGLAAIAIVVGSSAGVV